MQPAIIQAAGLSTLQYRSGLAACHVLLKLYRKHTDTLVVAMDLFAAERLNGKRWTAAKQSALLCFLVACALLGASLVLSQPADVDKGQRHSARTASPFP
jgi:hypothetical protein